MDISVQFWFVNHIHSWRGIGISWEILKKLGKLRVAVCKFQLNVCWKSFAFLLDIEIIYFLHKLNLLHLLLYMYIYIIFFFSSRKLLRILKIIIPGWVTPEVCYWIYFNNWINCFSLICPGSGKFVHVVWKERDINIKFQWHLKCSTQ